MDPKSIVLYLHRNDWTARVIHDDLVATLDEKSIAYNTVTRDLRDARINPSVATRLSDNISPHLDESDETILQALEEFPFYSLLFDSSPEPHIYQPLWSTGGYLRNLGLARVIFIGCDIVAQTIRMKHVSNVPNPFW
jgi:hypothetical protein